MADYHEDYDNYENQEYGNEYDDENHDYAPEDGNENVNDAPVEFRPSDFHIELPDLKTNEYATRLFDDCCRDSEEDILQIYFCSCVIQSKMAWDFDLEDWAWFAVCPICFTMPIIRRKIRNFQGIRGTWLDDTKVYCLCPFCALLQDMRELRLMKATDPTKSWRRQMKIPRE